MRKRAVVLDAAPVDVVHAQLGAGGVWLADTVDRHSVPLSLPLLKLLGTVRKRASVAVRAGAENLAAGVVTQLVGGAH